MTNTQRPTLNASNIFRDLNAPSEMAMRASAAKVRIAYKGRWETFVGTVSAIILTTLLMGWTGEGWRFDVDGAARVWVSLTLLGALTRLSISAWLKNRDLSDSQAADKAQLYAWNALFSGATWGSPSWFFLPSHLPAQELLFVVFMALLMTTSISGLTMHKRGVLAFSGMQTLIFISGELRLGDPQHVLTAFGFANWFLMMQVYMKAQDRVVKQVVELSMRNEELLAQRTVEEQAAQAARLEAEIARERAERADRAKTTFIAAASHDLRQPMHALVQYVAHLKRVCADPPARQTIAKIELAVAAMEDLLNAVLDFSKIAMGSVKPLIEPTDLHRVLAGIEMQVRPMAETKGLTLTIEGHSGYVASVVRLK